MCIIVCIYIYIVYNNVFIYLFFWSLTLRFFLIRIIKVTLLYKYGFYIFGHHKFLVYKTDETRVSSDSLVTLRINLVKSLCVYHLFIYLFITIFILNSRRDIIDEYVFLSLLDGISVSSFNRRFCIQIPNAKLLSKSWLAFFFF